MSDRKIGYIGLGNMGGGMASHLVASGYDVTVFDLRAEAVQALVDKGASAASSPGMSQRSAMSSFLRCLLRRV